MTGHSALQVITVAAVIFTPRRAAYGGRPSFRLPETRGEDQVLPKYAVLVVGGVEAVGVRDLEDLRVGVDVAAERDSAEAQPGVHAPEAEFHPRRIAGDGDGDPVTRPRARCRRQRVGIGVAADDAVHDHDVGDRHLIWLLSEICDAAVDPVVHAVL